MFINRDISSQRRSLWEQPKYVGDYKVAVPTMLCHRCSHASLSFHTVTLRFLSTELICVTRPSVVYTASCSPSEIYLSTRNYFRACQFTCCIFAKSVEVTLQFPDACS